MRFLIKRRIQIILSKINFVNIYSSYNIGGNFSGSNSIFNFRVGSDIVGRSYNVTIIAEYTKTTD